MLSSPTRRATRCLVALLCLLSSALASAQSPGGRILGRVAGPAGALLPGATVHLTNKATAITRDAQTNANGDYIFVEVRPGAYQVEFELTGFVKDVQKDVIVDGNHVVTMN